MIEIVVPTREEIQAVQDRDDAFYWSALTENILREMGIVSVATYRGRPSEYPDAVILTRGVTGQVLAALPSHAAVLVEGPLEAETARIAGVRAEAFAVDELGFKWQGGSAAQLYYPREFCKSPTGSVRADEPARWHRSSIRGQFLEGDGWDVLATATLSGDSRERPVVIAKGTTIIAGLPLFDLHVRTLAFGPLPYRYEKKDASPNVSAAVARLVDAFGRNVSKNDANGLITVPRWPAGKTAAFTVRHDFDRPASLESMMALLDFYGEIGVKASIGFLDYELPLDVIEQVCRRGHEVQLHSYAKDLPSFRHQLQAITSAARTQPIGVTIHGGPSGPGFLGETHYGWAEACGLRYVERFAASPGGAGPVARVGADGIPFASSLIGMSRHHSLDKSVPKENYYALLQQQIPRALAAGEYVTLMNHPDKNRDDLIKLIRGLDLRNVWRATQADVARWVAQTRFSAI